MRVYLNTANACWKEYGGGNGSLRRNHYTRLFTGNAYASAEALFFTRFAAIMKRAKNAAATMMPTG